MCENKGFFYITLLQRKVKVSSLLIKNYERGTAKAFYLKHEIQFEPFIAKHLCKFVAI